MAVCRDGAQEFRPLHTGRGLQRQRQPGLVWTSRERRGQWAESRGAHGPLAGRRPRHEERAVPRARGDDETGRLRHRPGCGSGRVLRTPLDAPGRAGQARSGVSHLHPRRS
ncbi:hypothetical protein BDY21DRAFT_347674 [Lineolata rhizophorae]|uniref:Uncharacterized protein n=1 Tax=Lineolata rhizophorae TaxID=578093 RepID=A0A6A6NXY7_9PEZI|nr:hypothetical protein BDY21DRAFT_347674 [Lineolata rhizophorae]